MIRFCSICLYSSPQFVFHAEVFIPGHAENECRNCRLLLRCIDNRAECREVARSSQLGGSSRGGGLLIITHHRRSGVHCGHSRRSDCCMLDVQDSGTWGGRKYAANHRQHFFRVSQGAAAHLRHLHTDRGSSFGTLDGQIAAEKVHTISAAWFDHEPWRSSVVELGLLTQSRPVHHERTRTDHRLCQHWRRSRWHNCRQRCQSFLQAENGLYAQPYLCCSNSGKEQRKNSPPSPRVLAFLHAAAETLVSKLWSEIAAIRIRVCGIVPQGAGGARPYVVAAHISPSLALQVLLSLPTCCLLQQHFCLLLGLQHSFG